MDQWPLNCVHTSLPTNHRVQHIHTVQFAPCHPLTSFCWSPPLISVMSWQCHNWAAERKWSQPGQGRAGQRQLCVKIRQFLHTAASRQPPHRWRERAELIDQEFISDSDSGHCLGTRNMETFIINISWSCHFVIQYSTCLFFKEIIYLHLLSSSS